MMMGLVLTLTMFSANSVLGTESYFEYSHIKDLQSPRSCTSELQKWNQPRKGRLESCSVDELSFTKHEYGKTKSSRIYGLRSPHEIHTTK